MVFVIVPHWLNPPEPTLPKYSDFELLIHPFECVARLDLETVEANSLIYEELDLDVRNLNDQRLDRLVESGELTYELVDRIVDMRVRLIQKIDERMDAKEIVSNPDWQSLISDVLDVYRELVESQISENSNVGLSK